MHSQCSDGLSRSHIFYLFHNTHHRRLRPTIRWTDVPLEEKTLVVIYLNLPLEGLYLQCSDVLSKSQFFSFFHNNRLRRLRPTIRLSDVFLSPLLRKKYTLVFYLNLLLKGLHSQCSDDLSRSQLIIFSQYSSSTASSNHQKNFCLSGGKYQKDVFMYLYLPLNGLDLRFFGWFFSISNRFFLS